MRNKFILEAEINPALSSNQKFSSNSPHSGYFASPKFYQDHTNVNTSDILLQQFPLTFNAISWYISALGLH